jgi:hypothetical protein
MPSKAYPHPEECTEDASRRTRDASAAATSAASGIVSQPLRMSNFRNVFKGLPHAEERQQGASRSTHDLAAVLH